MSHPFCPNPPVLQRLSPGPLGADLDTFVQSLVAQGYTSWTAKYTMRLLADLNSWLQRHALTAADLHEQRLDDFLQDRDGRYRPTRSDRSVLRRLLEHLRDHGVIPVPVSEADSSPLSCIAGDCEHSLLHQRCLAPTTVQYYLATVRRFLGERFGTQPLRLAVLCPQEVTSFMVQQAHRYSPGHAKLLRIGIRNAFFLPRAAAA